MARCTPDEMKATLIGLYMCTGGSPNAHVPPQCVESKLESGEARAVYADCLKRLVRKAYATKHPTRGGITYNITACGAEVARKLLREGDLVIDWSARC
jgi:hypothetical protein